MGISALPSPYQLSYSLQMHSNQDCNFPKAQKNAHTKKTKQLPPKKDPVLYSTEQIFTHTSLQSLHCFQVFPSIPSQTKNEKKKNKPTLHSEGTDDLKPELQQGKYLKVFTPQLSFSGQGAFLSVSPFPYQHWSSLKPHFNFLA